jgi:hypothetical protein
VFQVGILLRVPPDPLEMVRQRLLSLRRTAGTIHPRLFLNVNQFFPLGPIGICNVHAVEMELDVSSLLWHSLVLS